MIKRLILIFSICFSTSVLSLELQENKTDDNQNSFSKISLERYWTSKRMIEAKSIDRINIRKLKKSSRVIEEKHDKREKTPRKETSLDGAKPVFSSQIFYNNYFNFSNNQKHFFKNNRTFYVERDNYSNYPYITVGKIFFHSEETNEDYVCSGSSIGGRAVLTAGHCINDGKGNWFTRTIFVPAYRNGAAPYGKWSIESQYAFDEWTRGGSHCRDVGFLITNNNKNSSELNEVVGSLGFKSDYEKIHKWHQLGYPAGSPFDGSRMVHSVSNARRIDENANCYPRPFSINSRQTGGSSGGPWIRNFQDGKSQTSNYAASVTSYGYDERPGELYGPYFDRHVGNEVHKLIRK